MALVEASGVGRCRRNDPPNKGGGQGVAERHSKRKGLLTRGG